MRFSEQKKGLGHVWTSSAFLIDCSQACLPEIQGRGKKKQQDPMDSVLVYRGSTIKIC